MPSSNDPVLDPEGGHDPEALKQGADRMNVKTDTAKQDEDDDPRDEHDPEALEEAAERMNTK